MGGQSSVGAGQSLDLLTAGRGIPYQQDLLRFDLAAVIPEAKSNAVEDLAPLVPEEVRVQTLKSPAEGPRRPRLSRSPKGVLPVATARLARKARSGEVVFDGEAGGRRPGASGEHRHTPEQLSLRLGEQLVAPLQRRPERPLTRGRGAASAGQQPKAS